MRSRMGLHRALRTLPRETVDLYRESGSYVDGDWQEAGEVLVGTLSGVIHPLDDRERQRLELGEDDGEAIQIHTSTRLDMKTEDAGEQAYTIDWHGDRYRIIRSGDFARFGPSRYVALKVAS